MVGNPWAAFPLDRDDEDSFDEFPVAEETPSPSPTPTPARPGGLLGGGYPYQIPTFTNPVATDGDTIRDGDVRYRLQGIDAPELAQRGWRSDGSTVPLGELSQNYLSEQLYSPENLRLASRAPSSYGRIVGPIENDGRDIGLGSLRAGQSIAAPEYIDDPEMRFDYLQAERLARMNRLGVHGTVTLTPSEFRENPDYVPDRRDTALFADMPTPNAGMTSEQEQRYLHMLEFNTADEILEFFNNVVGYNVDEAHLRSFIAHRDAALRRGEDVAELVGDTVGYAPETRELIDPEDGQVGAAARQFGNDFLVGALDELGAIPDTLGLTEGRENVWNSERRLADIYWNNLYQNQAILRHDRSEYPTTSAVAGTAGALTSGFVLPYARGIATAPQLARWGAGYGAAHGFLGTDGGLSERATGAVQGGTIGAVLDPVLGKTLDAAIPAAQRLIGRMRGSSAQPASSAPASPLSGGPIGPQTIDQIDPELVAQVARASPLTQPRTRSELLASASTVQPRDVLPMPSNVPEAGELAELNASRFEPARPVNEATALQRQTVTNWRGEPVPKVGPLDLVGFIRSQGGLIDEGGELSAMGLTNAARRGLDHVGQETRFGPLVNNQDGSNLDDAALAAWEAGYFPEHSTRPDINTFLDGLRDTYEGQANRRFLPEDYGQVEGFSALRGERYELEQAISESDAPIYRDNSAPAGEAQAFPPVEAYEDWAGDAIERVGNIDVSKLDTPQDISRALRTAHNAMGGFDAATRGRISQGETANLAEELGMTAEQLLARRNGQAFNAEEALAARQILARSSNELVNAARAIQRLDDPGDELLAQFREKLVRHVAIQEQVAGITAEAGRVLQQFRQAADSRAVRGDVLSAFVRSGGGRGELQEAAEALIDAVEVGPGRFNTLAGQATNPRFKDKVSELYINALLSNPPTHVVNMVSNAITAVGQIPEYALASAIGGARRAVVGQAAGERILGSEVGARAFGLLQGTREGLDLFRNALRTGEADDFVSKVEGDQFKAISGFKGEVARLPTRFLTAEDQLFKGIARRMELNAQAVRIANREGLTGEERTARVAELVANPTDDMLARSLDYGLYLTYQRQLGETGRGLSQITSSSLPAKIVVPFVRTPINLLKFATERSPAAPLLREWRQDFAAGGERRDVALARMMLGTGIGYSFYSLAQQGIITGAAPPDPARARLMYADGWQPYSIRVGDRYISYSRLDPISTIMGVAADMATLPQNMSDRQREDQSTMLVASIMNNLANKTWLSGVASLTAGLADPQRNAENWLERTVSSFATPAVMGGMARQIDPVVRQREGVGEAIRARVPGMSDDLYPARNVFGEPRLTDSLGPDFISPFWQSQSQDDPVVAEMLRIQKSVSAPGKQFTEEGERVDYPRDVYDRYHEIAGRLTYNNLLSLIGSESYSGLDDAGKRRAAGRAIREARETARSVLDDPDYPLPAKGAGATDAFQEYLANDPFSDFPREGGEAAGEWDAFPQEQAEQAPEDEWGDFPEAGQRDVMGAIQQAIPGVRVTSGFRTREYQEDMRRRGYSPAQNSAHLDGSALDLVPPSGMSMQELARRVQQVEPEAYVLNEGDHLHVEFPDYFAAPALGGARAAGVRNPARVQ